jgi:hypothetical protein
MRHIAADKASSLGSRGRPIVLLTREKVLSETDGTLVHQWLVDENLPL